MTCNLVPSRPNQHSLHAMLSSRTAVATVGSITPSILTPSSFVEYFVTFIKMVLATICSWIVGFYFLGYLIPHIFVTWFYKTKNLKKAYDAKWALVTGSSSGRSISPNIPLLPS